VVHLVLDHARLEAAGLDDDRLARGVLGVHPHVDGAVDVDVGGLAADSLGPRRVGAIAFAAASAWVERVVLVSDEAIRDAQRRLWHDAHLVAEPGGAASLAGLIAGAYQPAADERVVVVVCGANTDPALVV